jgi:hypothetical protein
MKIRKLALIITSIAISLTLTGCGAQLGGERWWAYLFN